MRLSSERDFFFISSTHSSANICRINGDLIFFSPIQRLTVSLKQFKVESTASHILNDLRATSRGFEAIVCFLLKNSKFKYL